MRRALILIAAGAVALAACGGGDDFGDATDTTAGSTTSRPAVTTPTSLPPQVPDTIPPLEGGQVSTGEVPADILDNILDDAADRTSVNSLDIEVEIAEAVVWNDGSLGCPEPGVFYTQALVNGYRVVLVADGETLDYRVSERGTFFVCERRVPFGAGGTGGGVPSG